MITRCWLVPLVFLAVCGEPRASADDEAIPSAHAARNLEGWTVRVDNRLLQPPHEELGRRALRFLENKLADIKEVVPTERLQKLQAVTIVLDLSHGKLASMQYHPSASWLKAHGYSADLAKCVHIPKAADLPTRRNINEQPWVILHELAHAYHDQVLGFDEPRIREAYERYKKSGAGDKVLLHDGRRVRHYALTNPMEFFAEMTEAYFGVNDFFPFNRAELKEAHPEILALMRDIWEPPTPTSARAGNSLAPFEWQTATPENQGMSSEKLDALKDELARSTHAFLVIRNDKIVYEWYAAGHGPNKKHGAASLSKPTIAGLALALLLSDGKLTLDMLVRELVPAWNDDPRKRKITLRHLGSHTSGLADAEQNGLPHDKLTGWQGDFWKRLAPPDDPFTIARDKTPVLFEPGTRLQYSNPGIAMLGYAVTAALKAEPHKDIRGLLRERIMRPIGIADEDWSAGYGDTFKVNGLPLVAGWGGGSFSPRALARVGRLWLRHGDWDGRPILGKEAVRRLTGDAGLPGHCGMGTWTNADGRYPNLPRDAYYGAGAGDQVLLVVPSLSLIVVRNGETLARAPKNPKDVFEAFHDQRVKLLFEPILAAIKSQPEKRSSAPYPVSSFITRLTWAPKEQIIRKAKGSDNWPLTWADDDHQYTAYGDGWGFEPFVPEKLGLGFARVDGAPPRFTGVNIRSPSGEQIGSGAKAKKASGILCVDGVLHLWTRNAGNAQLAWSRDHGQTWTWADWKFTTSFGCPTFLNFGKNYAGARDEYVYVYSHDSDSAYRPADRMVLARVPKGKITERAAYEFFTGLDEKEQPLWSSDIARRGAVFTHRGRCYRSGISYSAGLKRYLWVQIVPGTEGKKADTRFEGGFGIYDAAQPWGPWTTVYFTDKWDVGPGETASFPTKWMSADGTKLHLVFSGDDHFAVREATVEKSPGGAPLLSAPADESGKRAVPANGPTDRRLAPFDKLMIEFLQKHPDIPGATIAVAHDGKIVYSRGFGHAEGKMAMPANAKMRIASISKPITAVAILQLIERGKLKLDSKVFDVLDLEEPKKGKFDARWRQVTIHQLLQHTGGWDRDKSFDPMFVSGDICAELKVKSPATQWDIIHYMLGKRLDFNPGTRYAYSNFGYCLLGRVIEKVSGLRYEEYVRREVLSPVGARDTHLGRTLRERHLKGEVFYDCGGKHAKAILGPNIGKPVLLPYGAWSLEALDSHGGWVATAPDLVRFATAFDHPERSRLLKAASIQAMFACPVGPAGHKKNGKEKDEFYGCGWSVRPTGNGTRNTWHNGLLDGTSTLLVHRESDKLTWAVLFNRYAPGQAKAAELIDPLVHAAADAVKEWPR
jgi:CubicO group peptidase (beta-lactamase class C family)